MSSDLLALRITRLEQVGGHWTARVSVGTASAAVDRSTGSWRITPAEAGESFRHVRPEFAAELQREVRRLERADARRNDV